MKRVGSVSFFFILCSSPPFPARSVMTQLAIAGAFNVHLLPVNILYPHKSFSRLFVRLVLQLNPNKLCLLKNYLRHLRYQWWESASVESTPQESFLLCWDTRVFRNVKMCSNFLELNSSKWWPLKIIFSPPTRNII